MRQQTPTATSLTAPGFRLAASDWVACTQLATAWLTLFVIGTDLFVVSPLLPVIAARYHTDPARAGLLVTVFACAYAIAAPAFGHLADRVGRRAVLLPALIAFAACNLLTTATTALLPMLACRLACGIAAAGVTPSIYVLVGDAAPPGWRGTWISVTVTGLLSALPLGATTGALLAGAFGWQSVFIALGGMALLLAVLNGCIWPYASARNHAAPTGQAALLPLVSALLPTLAWSTGLYGLYTYLCAGLAASGYAPRQVTAAMFVYGTTAFAGALISGRLSDRLGPGVAVRGALAALAVAFAGLALALHWQAGVLPAIGLTSVVAQLFFPAQQARLIGMFASRRATALSWNNSALFLGMTLGSWAGGQLMHDVGFAAIPVMSALLAIAGLASSREQNRESKVVVPV